MEFLIIIVSNRNCKVCNAATTDLIDHKNSMEIDLIRHNNSMAAIRLMSSLNIQFSIGNSGSYFASLYEVIHLCLIALFSCDSFDKKVKVFCSRNMQKSRFFIDIICE